MLETLRIQSWHFKSGVLSNLEFGSFFGHTTMNYGKT